MYYKVYVYSKGEIRENFIKHLYNNGYTFYETKNEEIIFVFEDEIDYVKTIAYDNGVKIEVED